MSDIPVDERRRKICRDARKALDQLVAIDGNLYREGFLGSSKSLGRIIDQLERWEARHAR